MKAMPTPNYKSYSVQGRHLYPKREVMEKILKDKNGLFVRDKTKEEWETIALQLRAIIEDLVAENKLKFGPWVTQISELRESKSRIAYNNEKLELELREAKKNIDIVKTLKEIIIELKTGGRENDGKRKNEHSDDSDHK